MTSRERSGTSHAHTPRACVIPSVNRLQAAEDKHVRDFIKAAADADYHRVKLPWRQQRQWSETLLLLTCWKLPWSHPVVRTSPPSHHPLCRETTVSEPPRISFSLELRSPSPLSYIPSPNRRYHDSLPPPRLIFDASLPLRFWKILCAALGRFYARGDAKASARLVPACLNATLELIILRMSEVY